MVGRFYKIYVPILKTGVFYAIGLAVGLTVSVVAGLIVLFAIISMLPKHTSMEMAYFLLLSPLFGISVGLAWLIGFKKFRNWRLLRPTALRTERLRLLMGMEGAARRLPHRTVEELLRRASHHPRKAREIVSDMMPGSCILVLLPGARGPEAPPHPIPFEAVEIDNHDERVDWLVRRHWFDDPVEDQTTDEGKVPEKVSSLRRSINTIRSSLALLLLAGCIGLVLWLGNLIFIGAIGALIVLPILWRLMVNRSWFIVPGGVVLREDRIWSRQTRLRMVTPDDSPLIADHRTGEALVMLDGRARKIVCPATLPLLVAAWQSAARRPTLEEVETLLSAE